MIAIIRLTCASLVFMISGCAYLNTYTRPVNLRDGAVAIDVKQRVVFSGSRDRGSIVCAEPSPDALTVIGASGGLSINSLTGDTGNISAALAESGASIGLRTQSIQLLRDAMYRLCEGYAGGAVTFAEFAAMQRRYQSTMLGLIAIEQLTGPVVASQALLASSTSSNAGAGISDSAVEAIQTNLDEAVEARLVAITNSEASATKVREKRSELKAVENSLRSEEEKKERDQEAIDQLKERRRVLLLEEAESRNDLADKGRRLQHAQRVEQGLRTELAAAQSSSSTFVSGRGKFTEAVARSTSESNQALATAVENIVKEINQSYSRDGCLSLVTELVRDPSSILSLKKVDAGDSSNVAAKIGLAEISVARSRSALKVATQAVVETKAAVERARIRGAVDAEIENRKIDAYQAEQAEHAAQNDVYSAENELKALKTATSDGARAVEVLKTSLEVCQRILVEEERKRVDGKQATAP